MHYILDYLENNTWGSVEWNLEHYANNYKQKAHIFTLAFASWSILFIWFPNPLQIIFFADLFSLCSYFSRLQALQLWLFQFQLG